MVQLGIHGHSLTSKEEKQNDDPPELCKGCLEPVLGPHYTCDMCNRLIMHKQCAELPPEIRHPIHPNHLLTLTAATVPDGSKCGVCSRSSPEGFILAYYCSGCKFWIDIKCAFEWQNDSHEHLLTFKEEKKNDGPPQFCIGCLEPVLGPHYTCDTCNDVWHSPFSLIMHKQCQELPPEIRHPIHPNHLLTLTTRIDITNRIKCGVCSRLLIGPYLYIFLYQIHSSFLS